MTDCALSMERLLDAKEAAALLNISGRKFWELTNTGEIPPVRVGRAVRFDPARCAALVHNHAGGRPVPCTAATERSYRQSCRRDRSVW